MLQSHLLSWDNRNATIASRVPTVPTAKDFLVVLAGPMTPPQELVLSKQHECDGARVQRLDALLRRINPLYRDVKPNRDFASVPDPFSVYCSRLADNNPNISDLVEQARRRQQTVAVAQEVVAPSDETTVVQSETVLVETNFNEENAEERLTRALYAIVGRPTYVARRSTSVLHDNDPFYMERVFPHLLTFGIGGFSSQRTHRYSKRDIVLHYLDLSTNRFAEDPLFKLKMFDFLSLQRVRNSVFINVKRSPEAATKAMHVSPEQLRAAIDARANKRKAAKSGRPNTKQSDDRSDSASLLKSINASTAKMWCSNQEREVFQRKVNAMAIMYGEPSVFWTLTPNPDSSIAVAFWAGCELRTGRPKDLIACTTMHMPTTAEMKRLVAQNTVLQAHYYELCCTALIDIMFGWESSVNRPKAEPGLFGFVEALFYALEQQGRLRVHHHGVLWVAGLPRTQADWNALLGDTALCARFEQYCASLFSAELPVFDALPLIVCPNASCDGQLAAVEIDKKYKHRLRSQVPPPTVASCNACSREYTEPALDDAVLESAWAALDSGQRTASTESAVRGICMRFGGPASDADTARVQMTRLLLKDQVHAYQHTHSCVKGTSGTKCRYKFYRGLEDVTGLNDNGEMRYRRRIGNQWLNPYIPLWRRLLHFNMDARMLGGGHGGLQASRYAIQYATKQQTVLDNASVVELAFRRRIEREAAVLSTKTELERGLARLMSLAFSSSTAMEVGGPLVTATLFTGGTAFFSCDFERLVAVEALRMMDNEDVNTSVVERCGQLFTDTSIRRYTSRPRCLEQCCWYEFCAWYKQTQIRHPQPGEDCTFVSDVLHDLANHVHIHGLARVDYPRVPEIVGPRLPDARSINDPEMNEKAELYYRLAAVLYSPFRDPQQFLDSQKSAKQHFEAWRPLDQPKVRRALDFHQQYYLALDEASSFHAQQAAADADDTCDDQDVLHNHVGDREGRSGSTGSLVSVDADLYDCAMDAPEVTDEDVAHVRADVDEAAMQILLANNVLGEALPNDACGDVVVRQSPITKAEMDAFQSQLTSEAIVISDGETVGSTLDPTTEVSVELLSSAVSHLTYRRPDTMGAQLEHALSPFATVQDVSQSFQLNEAQHRAFVHVAVPLLHKIANKELESDSCFSVRPLIITGAGGTGKTRIVEAVQALARSWTRPNSVMATASSGIAAANLGGHTMHSSVKLGINQKQLPPHVREPTEDLTTLWDPVLCVFADELSMTEIAFFGLWEEALRHVKNCNEPFGGLLTVLMFDFFQLETVSGYQLFRLPTPKRPFSELQLRGSWLYRSIDKVVYLTDNMRFAADPEWGEWLDLARRGNWCAGMRAFLQQAPPPLDSANALSRDFVQVISTDNAMRKYVNDSAVQIATRALADSRKVYAFPARLSKSTDLTALRRLPDSRTGNIPVFLKTYVGMPVRVKANQCIAKGVANGATGKVFHIDWHPDTHFERKADGVWVSLAPPTNSFVDVHNQHSQGRFPGIPDAWPSSVMPVVQSRATFSLASDKISIKGFPVVPAFGTTVHGVQGDTRNKIVVTDLRPPHFHRVDRHTLYVALSRVRTRAGLFWAGRRLNSNDFEFFCPSEECLQEDERLRELAAALAAKTAATLAKKMSTTHS